MNKDALRILFFDEKFFDIGRVYKSENERVWAINRADADETGGVMQKQNFPRESGGVVGCSCSSKGLTPLVILNEETVDYRCYIKNTISVALKYGNEVFGDRWLFQQDGANSHRHHLTQGWRPDNFASLIDKDRSASKQSRFELSG